MTQAYDWSEVPTNLPVIDMKTYLSMPEELSRRVEVRDGMLVHCESPSPNHISICRALEHSFRNAVRKRGPDQECLRVSGDLDMLMYEVPFTFRRPDLIVYRCIENGRGKWDTKPTAADTLLVVEVVSPGTVTADSVDKRAEYAHLGIPAFWIVRMANNNGRVKSIEMLRLTSEGKYVTEKVCLRSHDAVAAVSMEEPLEVSVTWEELDADVE